MSDKTGWHFSPWLGICYGDIPVGVIVLGGGLVVWKALGGP